MNYYGKNEVKLYNILLPIWILVFCPTWLWLILIPANYLIDRLVLQWSLGEMPEKGTFCRKHTWKICIAGFFGDLCGAIVLHRIVEGIHSKHIYVHLDLDVVDPQDFPNTPLPVDNGLFDNEVFDILDAVSGRLTGLGIYEYAPCGVRSALVEKVIRFGMEL